MSFKEKYYSFRTENLNFYFFSSLVFFTYCQNLITFNLDFKTYFKKDIKVFPG